MKTRIYNIALAVLNQFQFLEYVSGIEIYEKEMEGEKPWYGLLIGYTIPPEEDMAKELCHRLNNWFGELYMDTEYGAAYPGQNKYPFHSLTEIYKS